jgi:hypothetical protein
MRTSVVYTLHLWPPLGHAKHYTGSAKEGKLAQRLTDHALGRGARLTQVQAERGGSWVVAQTQPGDRTTERQLKQHGAVRRCDVCKAVDGYQAGELSPEQALARAGWDRASAHERGLLLDMLGISQAPTSIPAPQPAPSGSQVSTVPGPRPAGSSARYITPEIVAAVDRLEATWAVEAASQATAAVAEPEAGS